MKSKFTILLFTILSTTVLVLVIIYNKTQSQSYISTQYSNNNLKTTATHFYMVMEVANAQKRLWSNKH